MNQQRIAGFGLASFLMLPVLAGCSSESVAREFHVTGHRGSPYSAVENTIPSFEAAAREGANAIETDLCMTKDNRIVIWHDSDPDSAVALLRQSGGEGLPNVPFVPPIGSPERRPVRELTFGELRKYYGYAPAGSFDRDPTAIIPEVGELFAWLADHDVIETLFLDIKLAPGETAEADLLVKQIAEEHKKGPETKIFFLSVHDSIAQAMEAARVREGADELRVIRDYEDEGALEGATALGLRDVTTGYTLWRSWDDYTDEVEDLVAARDEGVLDSVVSWTINDPEGQEELIRIGVDGIMTDKPAALGPLYQQIRADEQRDAAD